jgi:hypothetical protein
MEDTHIINVTPELAKEWLDKNHHNRPLSQTVINNYAEDMKEGLWSFTGDTIKFSKDGMLLDGQHRLAAVVKSKKAQRFLIVRNLKESVFVDLDIGRKRTMSNVLAIRYPELKYQNQIAAVARICSSFDLAAKSGQLITTPGKRRINYHIIDTFYEQNKELLLESFNYVLNLDTADKVITKVITASMHYLFSKIDKSKADEYIRLLITGENLSRQSAIYNLREKLIEFKYKKSKGPYLMFVVYFTRSWNAWVTGVNIKLRPTMEYQTLIKP